MCSPTLAHLSTPMLAHAHTCPPSHTHLHGMLASGSCLATEVKHTSPSLTTFPRLDAFLAKEHSLSFHRVMGSWYYNVAGMTNTYFSLTKKLWLGTWKTCAWRLGDRQFRNTSRSFDVPSKAIKLLKPIKKQNKQKCHEQCRIFL